MVTPLPTPTGVQTFYVGLIFFIGGAALLLLKLSGKLDEILAPKMKVDIDNIPMIGPDDDHPIVVRYKGTPMFIMPELGVKQMDRSKDPNIELRLVNTITKQVEKVPMKMGQLRELKQDVGAWATNKYKMYEFVEEGEGSAERARIKELEDQLQSAQTKILGLQLQRERLHGDVVDEMAARNREQRKIVKAGRGGGQDASESVLGNLYGDQQDQGDGAISNLS